MKVCLEILRELKQVKKYVKGYVEKVQFLINNGGGVHVQDIMADSLKMEESYVLKERIIRYLDTNNVHGFTSLMFAASKEDIDMLNWVIRKSKKLDINKEDDSGYTALMYACRFNKGEGVVKILLDNKADIIKKDKDGKTALDFAKENNNEVIVDLLCNSVRDLLSEYDNGRHKKHKHKEASITDIIDLY